MWLDRLAHQAHASGSSTPQPASRPYSPLPRRTSSSLSPYPNAQRPGQSPRGSSLSLVSNDSSTSLLSQSRRPNTSGLRQSSTVFNGPDPGEVLARLLQTQSLETPHPQSFVTEEDLDLVPDFQGLSLSEIASSQTNQDDESLPSQSQLSHPQDCRCPVQSPHRLIY